MRPQDGYVWFLPSWLHSQWWVRNGSLSNQHKGQRYAALVKCTDDEMKEFVNGGYFSLANSFFAGENKNVVGGYTVNDWKKEYKKNVGKKVRRIIRTSANEKNRISTCVLRR
jgi:hypothetical protein